jgi:hypothetical protein
MCLWPLTYWDCGFESHRMPRCLSVRRVVWCEAEVPASGWSPIQRSPTKCGMFKCGREAWIMKRPWPSVVCLCVCEFDYCHVTVHWQWSCSVRNPGPLNELNAFIFCISLSDVYALQQNIVVLDNCVRIQSYETLSHQKTAMAGWLEPVSLMGQVLFWTQRNYNTFPYLNFIISKYNLI